MKKQKPRDYSKPRYPLIKPIALILCVIVAFILLLSVLVFFEQRAEENYLGYSALIYGKYYEADKAVEKLPSGYEPSGTLGSADRALIAEFDPAAEMCGEAGSPLSGAQLYIKASDRTTVYAAGTENGTQVWYRLKLDYLANLDEE